MAASADVLFDAIHRGDDAATRAWLASATEADRKSALPSLKKLRKSFPKGTDYQRDAVFSSCCLAIIGCTQNPAGMVSELRNYTSVFRPLEVFLNRDVNWKQQVFDRLSNPPSPRNPAVGWGLVEELRIGLGLPIPGTPTYAVALLEHLMWECELDGIALTHAIRTQPEVLALIPVALTSPHLDVLIQANAEWALTHGWPRAIADLCAESLLVREEILQIAVTSWLNHSRGPTLAASGLVVHALEPTPDEVAQHRETLIAALDNPHSPTVSRALKLLGSAISSTTLEELCLIAQAILIRPGKSAALTVLGWLKQAAAKGAKPDHVALAASQAFSHPKREVAERAVKLIASLPLDPMTLARVAASAESLDEVIRPLASPFAGTSTTKGWLPSADPHQLPELPARIRDLSELVDVAIGDIGFMEAERLLDAVARFRDEAAQIVDEFDRAPRTRFNPYTSQSWSFARMLFDGRTLAHPRAEINHVRPHATRGSEVRCVRELLSRMRSLIGVPPDLADHALSYPDSRSGHVDPERVLADLAAAVGTGTQFSPSDIAQTLLRLPLPHPDDLYDRLRAIGGSSAERLASLVGRGSPRLSHWEIEWTTDNDETSAAVSLRWSHLDRLGRFGTDLILLDSPNGLADAWRFFPSCREAAAAFMIGPQGRSSLGILPHLHGRAGELTYLALGGGMSDPNRTIRMMTVEALIGFAAQPELLDVAGMGACWANSLADRDGIKFGRWQEVLSEVHRRSHRKTFLWPLLSEMIAAVLMSQEGMELVRRPGFADLIDLAADVAPATRRAFPRLECLVGTSKLGRAAKRLLGW